MHNALETSLGRTMCLVVVAAAVACHLGMFLQCVIRGKLSRLAYIFSIFFGEVFVFLYFALRSRFLLFKSLDSTHTDTFYTYTYIYIKLSHQIYANFSFLAHPFSCQHYRQPLSTLTFTISWVMQVVAADNISHQEEEEEEEEEDKVVKVGCILIMEV
jgi:hypothetical protein